MPAHAAARSPRPPRSLAILLLIIIAVGVPTTAMAADEPAAKAENSLDPFDGKPIDPTIAPVALTVAGRTWVIGFSSVANLRSAQADPRRAVDLHRKRLGEAANPADKLAPKP